MSDAKFTKGPWNLPDVGTARGSVLVSRGGPHSDWKGMVCSVDAGNYAASAEEGLANAHLIAAAPEMYEAIREAVEDAEKAVNPSARIFGYEKFKAALAKAEGR